MTATPDDAVDPATLQAARDRRATRAAVVVLCGVLVAFAGLFFEWSGTVVKYHSAAGTTFAIRSVTVFGWSAFVGLLLLLIVGVAGVIAVGLVFFRRSLVGTHGTARAVFLLCGIALMGLAIWHRGEPGPSAVFAGGLAVALGGAVVSLERADPSRSSPAVTSTDSALQNSRGPRAAKRLGIAAIAVVVTSVVLVVALLTALLSGPSSEGDLGVGIMGGLVILVGILVGGGLGLAAIIVGVSSSSHRPPGAKRPARAGIVLGTIAILPIVIVMVAGAVGSMLRESPVITIPSYRETSELPPVGLTITAEPTSLNHLTGGTVHFVVTYSGGERAGAQVSDVRVWSFCEASMDAFDRTDEGGAAELRFSATELSACVIQASKDGYRQARMELAFT